MVSAEGISRHTEPSSTRIVEFPCGGTGGVSCLRWFPRRSKRRLPLARAPMPNNTARGVYASTAVRAESPANEVNGAMRKIARRSLPSFLGTVFTMPRVRPRRQVRTSASLPGLETLRYIGARLEGLCRRDRPRRKQRPKGADDKEDHRCVRERGRLKNGDDPRSRRTRR